VHAAGDVPTDGFERAAAGNFALVAAADTVGDHHQQGDPFAPGQELIRVGQAGVLHHHLLSQ
jgi:hypothetical protein